MRSNHKPAALIEKPHVPPPRIALSIREASLASSLSQSTIKKLIREGKLPVSRKTGRTLISPAALERFLFGEKPQNEGN